MDAKTLRSLDVSAGLARHYVHAGWLLSLGRGVFMFPNDTLNRDACLTFLAKRIPGFHVAGKTALAWRGVRHNLASTEQLYLLGDVPKILPDWFTNRFSATYASHHVFRSDLPLDFGLQPLPENPNGPLVSVPERALLEMLSEVGRRQGVEEARNVMEGVRSLRPDVLQPLLKACVHLKVVRLCVQWAAELELAWAPAARQVADTLPSKARWSARFKDGTVLVLKP